MDVANRTLTAVPGIAVGHAAAPGGESGCTVVLGPFRAAVEVLGMATGSRELGTLDPRHVVQRIEGILLTGGSAFGLASADGVVRWLEERGRGHPTGVAPVPIVPGVVIYDLAPGRARPGPETGYAACEAASGGPVAEGRVGVGLGASVGKALGLEFRMPGGVGTHARPVGAWTMGALAVVNALGDVLDGRGEVVAGARDNTGAFLGVARTLARRGAGVPDGAPDERASPAAGENTTLLVVATDAPLGRVDLARLARTAAAAPARRISPFGTPFDGDVLFMISTAEDVHQVDGPRLLELGAAACEVLEEAITRSVAVEG